MRPSRAGMQSRGKGRDWEAVGAELKEGKVRLQAELGWGMHLRFVFKFLNYKTKQWAIKTLFQTDEVLNFISSAKPGWSDSFNITVTDILFTVLYVNIVCSSVQSIEKTRCSNCSIFKYSL